MMAGPAVGVPQVGRPRAAQQSGHAPADIADICGTRPGIPSSMAANPSRLLIGAVQDRDIGAGSVVDRHSSAGPMIPGSRANKAWASKIAPISSPASAT